MKKVAFFDIDGVIYGKEVFLALAQHAVKSGWLSPTVLLGLLNPLKQSDFGKNIKSEKANQFLETVASALQGKDFDGICTGVVSFFMENKTHFYSYFEIILPKLKESHDIYIVTTNAQFVAKPLVDIFGLSGYISSEFEVVNGLFTGKVSKSLANGKSEVQIILQKYGQAGSIAVGDSENDISMLELVACPICINPSETLEKYALDKGWITTTSEDASSVFKQILI